MCDISNNKLLHNADWKCKPDVTEFGMLTLTYRVFQKTDPLVYFDDNFGKYGPILTIFYYYNKKFTMHKN